MKFSQRLPDSGHVMGPMEGIIKLPQIMNVDEHLHTTETYYIYKETKKGEPKLMIKTPPTTTAFSIYKL